MAALTEIEKSKILRFLGFPDWATLALSWSISFPTAIEPQYQIQDAFYRMSDEALELIREDMRQCEAVESQLKESIKRLKASKVGEITLNPDEQAALRGELNHWKAQLANDFGTILNPYKVDGGSSRNGVCVG